jgi:hypothetical protein
MTAPKARSPEHHAVDIYVGRQHLGTVIEVKPSVFEAADAEGNIVGVFPSVAAAGLQLGGVVAVLRRAP